MGETSDISVLGVTPENSGLIMVGLIFTASLARAGVCAAGDRASRLAHAWAVIGLIVTLVSIGLIYALQGLSLTGALAATALFGGLALRAIGLGLTVYGFGRAAMIGGRAVWIDWILAALFTLGLLVFAAVLYNALDLIIGLAAAD